MNAQKIRIAFAALTVVALLATLGSTPLQASVRKADRPIPGSYIVVLRDGAVRAPDAPAGDGPTLPELANQMARSHRGVAGKRFGAALSGFTFRGDAQAAEAMSLDSRVAYVAEDGIVELAEVQTPTPSWGLDRIDQRESALDDAYLYNQDGLGIDLYIVDTGIRSSHTEFGNRVDTVEAFTAIADGLGTEDCHGHGTHVAGVAAGSTFGVAKAATLHPVRVMDCSGQGAISNVIAGVDWITSRYPLPKRNRQAPPTLAVANLSLSAGISQPLDEAIAASIARGVTYVVAAGNEGLDACQRSPSRVPGAITVGAADAANARPAFSNYGACIDVFAPGVMIVSSFIRSDDDAIPMTGTSVAAPHVAGTAALMLAANPEARPQDVEATIRAAATADALTNVGSGSPNLLLYSAWAGSGEDFPPFATFTFYCLNGACDFDATGSADDWGILDYSWDFGDGRGGRGDTPRHRYNRNSGPAFLVTLTVTDTSGQTATMVREVRTSW